MCLGNTVTVPDLGISIMTGRFVQTTSVCVLCNKPCAHFVRVGYFCRDRRYQILLRGWACIAYSEHLSTVLFYLKNSIRFLEIVITSCARTHARTHTHTHARTHAHKRARTNKRNVTRAVEGQTDRVKPNIPCTVTIDNRQ